MGHEERFPLPRRVAAIGSVKERAPGSPITTGKRQFRTFPVPAAEWGGSTLCCLPFKVGQKLVSTRLAKRPAPAAPRRRLSYRPEPALGCAWLTIAAHIRGPP